MQGCGQAAFAGQGIKAAAGLPGGLGHQVDPLLLQIGRQLRIYEHIAVGPGAHHQHLGRGRQGLGDIG